ncbi:sensor histidine kinase [Umezakia ovalisporum]|jgi:signal transduction histidine kinase|uniref:histidine kinase n=2 Tax=Umezakia ovalisporum TaxID=75695 RepID=A0AA43GWF5_9CYAN|nr:HAMP domain-containing sensor histidine kinase [Umezakia ovalisporum]MBI1242284.1 PAS domain-containing sensor histidine kinase [Nostoc sp. RI_552]MDH6057540.1 ATP-binding protein [Umezakia ovalisporum FSS-43]MDH6062844.1 ATP-binding protein [Umezakia ovalisporum FSS-62]MDH6069070.1 ATP-binding protein [Umezakia ovalisporum APH033B]MDH6070708.1 ATP-binding protein [Umezakia ovalisporum CobakiLakeA]
MNSSGHRLVFSDYEWKLQPEIDLKFAYFFINQSVEAAFCLGENEQFIYINDATCKITEYSREELLLMALHDIDIDYYLHNWSEIKSAGSFTFISRYRTKGGRIFLAEISIIYGESSGTKFGCAVVREKSDEIIDLSVQTWIDQLRNVTVLKSEECKQVKNHNPRGKFEYQEMNILTKDGTEPWLACAVAQLGGMLDFQVKQLELITGIDITDYKNLESDLNKALEQAKQLSDMRARFLSMVCHQLRTPLNIVSFSNSLLKEQVDKHTEKKIQPLLEHIEKAIEEISQMLDDTLNFAKAETAKIHFKPQSVDLVEFCNHLVAQMHMSISHKPIIFISEFDLLTAWVDPKILEPILKNLLDNAIKYSPWQTSIDFTLACENGQVIFQVKDRGIGIPSADQQRLFEPFFRGSNVDNIPGTGLGLSIIKTLVDLHGGEVTAESETGVGTKFTVILPLIKKSSVFS